MRWRIALWRWWRRITGAVGRIFTAVWTHLDMAMVVAILALAVSTATYYRDYVYVRRELNLTLANIFVEDDDKSVRATFVAVNSGNRDAVVLELQLLRWLRKPYNAWNPLNDVLDYTFQPVIVRPSEIKLISVQSAFDAVQAYQLSVPAREGDARNLYLGANFMTLDDKGERFWTTRVIGSLFLSRQKIDESIKVKGYHPVGRTFPVFSFVVEDSADVVRAYGGTLIK